MNDDIIWELRDKLSASLQLNKTLMGLLEKEYVLRCADNQAIPDWQSYCKEHNLKIDTDGRIS